MINTLMPKYILTVILTAMLSFPITRNGDPKQYTANDQENDGWYYYFYYDYSNNQEILKSLPVGLPQNTPVKIVVDSLLKYLSDNYFRNYNNIYVNTKIKLYLVKIDSVRTKSRVYRIATINISDTNTICMRSFFQGSTGGHVTYITIAANILQPQFSFTSPFLDGVIVLYNGSPITGLDHIDIDGILIPKTFYMNAMEAINRRH